MAQKKMLRETKYKPRIVIYTDIPPLDVILGDGCEGLNHKCSDPDDIQSMIRFLLSASEFDVQVLITAEKLFKQYASDDLSV